MIKEKNHKIFYDLNFDLNEAISNNKHFFINISFTKNFIDFIVSKLNKNLVKLKRKEKKIK